MEEDVSDNQGEEPGETSADTDIHHNNSLTDNNHLVNEPGEQIVEVDVDNSNTENIQCPHCHRRFNAKNITMNI